LEAAMFISAQVSLYPLRQQNLSPAIEKTLAIFKNNALQVSPGAMSSVVSGEDGILFDALREAFRTASAEGDVVMAVTFSNACPVELGK
jgi:uncharacterized protein YqgV (UPF0045/DUF77 family)